MDHTPSLPIRLISLDLDGTLLDSNKRLPPMNETALRRAAAAGIEIVPTTGRFYEGMPDVIRSLPYIRYAITVNGAQVYDLQENRVVYRAEIPWERAVKLMEYLDGLPVIYDCFMANWGWMTRRLWDQAEVFAPNEHYARMLRQLRTPVEELKAFLADRRQDVQKIQLFTRDMDLRTKLLRDMPAAWPDLIVSSSVENNIEINGQGADKGEALLRLAEHLGILRSETMAFGDGLNDVSMLLRAGTGVAMGNACPEAAAAADIVTADCDHHGVADIILQYCL